MRGNPTPLSSTALATISLMVIKKDAGRTVKLINNNPLRSVYDKSAVFSHQRDFAKINFLLFNIADLLCFGCFPVDFTVSKAIHVKNHQSDNNFQRSRIGHAFLNTLLHIIPDITKLITDKLQRTLPAKIRNGKTLLKAPCKPRLPRFAGANPFWRNFS